MSEHAIPPVWRNQPFTPETATIWGLTTRQVQRMGLDMPTRGVRSLETPATTAARCKAFALVLEVFAFSHVTAALLHDLPLPSLVAEAEQLHIMRPKRDGAVRRQGTIGHSGLNDRVIVDIDGLPVVDLADTWVDLGELVRPGVPLGLDDLVVVGDAIAQRLGSVEPLREALARRVRPRGKLTLLEALDLIRVGSESPGETRTRLVLVRAGLPEPELNQPIVADSGRWLGRPDLRYTHPKIVIEYQGEEFHGSDDARASDRVRFRGFREDGWAVVEVWAEHLNTDEARYLLVLEVARLLGIHRQALRLNDCHPRFFSNRMLELAELRARRRRARRA